MSIARFSAHYARTTSVVHQASASGSVSSSGTAAATVRRRAGATGSAVTSGQASTARRLRTSAQGASTTTGSASASIAVVVGVTVAPRHVKGVSRSTATPGAWVTWDRNDLAATSYEVLRDGLVVGTVAVSGDAHDDCVYLDAVAPGTYSYQVRAIGPGSSVLSAGRLVKVVASSDYGAIFEVDAQAGATDTARAQAAIDAAIAAGGGVVKFGGTLAVPKTYDLGPLAATNPNKVLFMGGGRDATILQPNFDGDASAVANPAKLITFTGTLAALTTTLSAAIAVGDQSATVVDATGLAVGDLIVLDQMNPQQDPEAMRVAGVTQDPGTPNDRRYPWDANEIVAISGTTVTFRHPFSQPFTTGVTWQRYSSGRDVGVESMTIQGRSSTEATFYRLVDFVNCARVRVADVRARWANKSYFRFSRVYDFSVVGLRGPYAGPSGFGGTGTKYKLDVQRVALGFFVDAEMGETAHQNNQSYITMQWAQRVMVRHSRFFGSDNYAINEHGGGSRHCIFENNFISKCASSAFFVGNTTWGPSGECIIRNNTLEDNAREVYAQENSYGIRVLDNISRRVTTEFMYWMGWGQKVDASYTPIPDTNLWGSAKMVVRGNQVLSMGATANGLIFGRSDSSWYPYLGMRDVIIDGNRVEAASTTQRAVWLRGDSTTTLRFQVRNTTGTNLSYVKPAFVAGDHWENNANSAETYGSAVAVPWDDEFFSWEVNEATAPTVLQSSGSGSLISSGSAVATIRYRVSGTGAATTSGSASARRRLASTAAGTLVTTGQAVGQRRLQATAVGQSTSSGAAAALVRGRASASGLTTTTGTADARRRLRSSAAGNLASSGSASAVRRLRSSASGQLTSTGTATAHLRYLAASAGLLSTSGSLSARLRHLVASSGQLGTQGTASATTVHTAASSGVLVTTGSASVGGSARASASGSLVTAGSATAVRRLRSSGIGQLVTQGTVGAVRRLRSLGSGQLVSTGQALAVTRHPTSAFGSTFTSGSGAASITGTVSASGAVTTSGAAAVAGALRAAAGGRLDTSGQALALLRYEISGAGTSSTSGQAGAVVRYQASAAGLLVTSGTISISLPDPGLRTRSTSTEPSTRSTSTGSPRSSTSREPSTRWTTRIGASR